MPNLKITNDSKIDFRFQIEPEGYQFSISPGDFVRLHYDYETESPEIILGETSDPVFGAIVPGDGSLQLEKNNEIIYNDGVAR